MRALITQGLHPYQHMISIGSAAWGASGMILMRGNSGNEVAAVQFALNGVSAFMPKLKVDGIFGSLTHERVRQHQTAKRLKPDGIVGPLTFSELFDSVALDGLVRITRTDRSAGIGGGVASRFSI